MIGEVTRVKISLFVLLSHLNIDMNAVDVGVRVAGSPSKYFVRTAGIL